MIVLLAVVLVVLVAVTVEAVAVYRERRRPSLPDRIRALELELGIGAEPQRMWGKLSPLGVTPTNFTQIISRPVSFAPSSSWARVVPIAAIAHKLQLEEALYFGARDEAGVG